MEAQVQKGDEDKGKHDFEPHMHENFDSDATVFQTGVDAFSMGLHLATCHGDSKHCFSHDVKLPWERRFISPADHILKLYSMPSVIRTVDRSLVGLRNEQENKRKPQQVDMDSAFRKAGLRAKKHCDEKLWQKNLSDDRKAAVAKWMAITTRCPLAWDVCIRHFSSGQGIGSSISFLETLADTLGRKESGTLHARANPLLRFMKFCRQEGVEPWPVSERLVYGFLKSDEKFAPTFPRSFMVSLSFSRHVLGLRGEIDTSLSGRTKGFADVWFLKKRRLIQKSPLSVAQVIHLEKTVMDARRSMVDRIGAGFFLFTLYARARYTDALNVSSLTEDVVTVDGEKCGFLEAQSKRVKTNLTLEKKTRFLPMSVPISSVGQTDWAETWMGLRFKEKLDADEETPLLPAPLAGNQRRWSKIPLSAANAADWLRSLLSGIDGPSGMQIGTHSLKATLLSWSAKFGLPVEDRRALGYHSPGKDLSVLTYSRDALSKPLRSLQTVLDAIVQKAFFPDSTRSGYFNKAVGDVNFHGDSDGSSESSADEEDKDVVGDEEAIEEVAGSFQSNGSVPWTELAAVFFRHKASRCIHVLMDEGGADFLCGRKISCSYERLAKRPVFIHPMCSTCERAISKSGL